MVNKIKCLLGIHKWTTWKFIKKSEYGDELHKWCKICCKKQIYKGYTEKCIITGKLSPYIMKH